MLLHRAAQLTGGSAYPNISGLDTCLSGLMSQSNTRLSRDWATWGVSADSGEPDTREAASARKPSSTASCKALNIYDRELHVMVRFQMFLLRFSAQLEKSLSIIWRGIRFKIKARIFGLALRQRMGTSTPDRCCSLP